MPRDDKLDDDLRAQMETLGQDDEVEVLVYPGADAGGLERDLAGQQDEGALRYNPLPLHGTVAVRARRRVIEAIARRPDVARVSAMPTASI